MEIRVGTSGFAYPPWRGRFYPDELADDDMLRYAAGLPTVDDTARDVAMAMALQSTVGATTAPEAT